MNRHAKLLSSVLLAALLLAVTAHADLIPRQWVFAAGETTVPFEEDNGDVVYRAAASYRTPSLSTIDGALLILADALYSSGVDESFIESASRLSIDGGHTWVTQTAIKNKRAHPTLSRVMDPTVVVKGKKAFALVGSWNESTINWCQQSNGDDWDALIAVGELRRGTKNGSTTAWMDWGKPFSVKSAMPEIVAGAKSTLYLGGVGTGLLMENGTIVFPVQVCNVNHETSVTILYSADDGKTWHFGAGTTPTGCSENNVIEWDGKLITNTRRDDGYRMVLESPDMGATWTETPLSRVWGSSPGRSGPGSQASFITVNINNKKAMLLSAPRNLRGAYERDRLLLWLSDGSRIAEIGQISEGATATGYSSLAYIDGNLHVVYEMPKYNLDGNRTLMIHSIPDLTRKVESVLEQWAAQDRLLASAGVPTEGLVALLSDAADGDVWQDVYGGVNATTTNGRKVTNGFQFTGGRFGGAHWPVTLQGQFQRFHFTRKSFTLAASITVDEQTARNMNSPLGAALDESGEAKVLGLRYTIDGLWNPVYGYISDRLLGSVEEWREYHVALVFADDEGRVYIDGKALEGAPSRMRYVGAAEAIIDHFYMGGYAHGELDRDCRTTMKNVMLYNRVLSEEEIGALYMNRGKIRLAS